MSSVVFLFGSQDTGHMFKNATLQQKLLAEYREHRDLVHTPHLKEHYENLTLKTIYTLLFALVKGKTSYIWYST